MPAAKPFHVLIVGAGSTGLLIAQGLKQAGISFEIFERETPTTYISRPRDWTMALHWGSDYIYECLPEALVHKLETDARVNPGVELTEEQKETLPVLNGETGEVVTLIRGTTIGRVAKSKLRGVFGVGIETQWGKVAKSIEDIEGGGVRVKFTDGTEATGDILVGSDGVNGPIRQIILPEGKATLELANQSGVNITNKYTAEQTKFIRSGPHPMLVMCVHGGIHTFALIIAVDTVPTEEATYQLILTQRGSSDQPPTNEERVARMHNLAAQFCEPIKSAFAWVRPDVYIHPDAFSSWKDPVPWNNRNGHVTLAGDAAHPMTPFRGQGLNNALEDAATFVKAMKSVVAGEKDLKEAVDGYDKEVFTRGFREIVISMKQGHGMHDLKAFMQSPLAKAGMTKAGMAFMNEGHSQEEKKSKTA